MDMIDSYPWHCACGRLNGKRHTHCPACKGHWSAGTPHSNEPKSPRVYQSNTEYNTGWDWTNNQQKATKKGKKNQRWRSESARRSGKGKGKSFKGQEATLPSPFAQPAPSAIPPWPTPEATTAQQQAPIVPAVSAAHHAELLSAVRKHYPDLSQAPEDIQKAVDKSEKATTKVLTSDLNKASKQVGKSCQTAFNSQGCSSSSQAELVEASPRLSCELAEATTVVQRPAEGVRRATHQSAAGAQLGQAAFAASEQAGSRDRCPGVNRNRRGDGQSCRSRQLPQLRSRSSCASATSPRKSRAKHCRSLSRQACRSHVGRGRGRCRQKAQTASIHGTIRRWTTTWIWWAHIITQAVNLGSEDLCLRNELHEPLMKQKATEEADAYCHNYCCDAACHPDLRTLIRCHSIHWDPNFLSEPVALGRATLLRNEVLSFVNPATNARSPLEPKANLKSCLKS